jgi:hypothetical protein
MSGAADHLVVPFTVFLERREHLRTLAAGLCKRAGDDAVGPAAPEKDDAVGPAAPEKKGSADHARTPSASELPPGRATHVHLAEQRRKRGDRP